MRSLLPLLYTFVLFSTLFSCNLRAKKNLSHTEVIADAAFDNHSYANVRQIRTTHLHLDLDVNFDNQTIYGVARHTMQNYGTDTAIFDIKGLEIQKITLGKGKEKETDFIIGQWDKDSILGQPLLVTITSKTTHINIYYKTTNKTEALGWLNPELTTGKKHPFVYTQGQAILTRSWIPLQDSPANRITYSANVKVPQDLMAVMSAENPTKRNDKGVYFFQMKQPIPCYLIALAVGNIAYKKLGTNCGVYSEPELLRSSAKEFSDLPRMIQTAEKLYGKYRWQQYDLLVLPYSFPFGGMENPRLTFVNPTVIAGDKSLVSVIAHELAHSWSGNLVTNRSWDDFWLNEGFTVYFENRIMEALYGKEISDILALIEFQELQDELKEIGESAHPEDTRLKLQLRGRDPDDGLTDIAYVKGAFFLKTLERDAGRERLDKFLNSYFKAFAFKTVSSETFIEYLDEHLLVPHNLNFNTKEWVYKEGIPKNCYQIVSPRFNEVQSLADRFAKGENIFKRKVKWIKIKGRRKKKKQVIQLTREKHIAQEWQAFIRRLPNTISADKLRTIDKHLHFRDWTNSEIQYEWYIKGIRAGYTDIRPSMEKFLLKVGRRKYVAPIYKELAKSPENLAWALDVFEKAQVNYHPVTKNTVQELLDVK
jgi:leukotriene-A4 hydrolase